MHEIRIVEQGGKYEVQTKPPFPWWLLTGWYCVQDCSSVESARKYRDELDIRLNSPRRIVG